MLSENDVKEALSLAYVQAVCGMAGYNYGTDAKDYGFDITIKSIIQRQSGRLCLSGYNVDLQIKATTVFTINGTHVKYSLKNKNYNDLAEADPGTKRILVVLLLPEEKTSWLNQDPESLVMKKCAYWISLEGSDIKTNEDSSTTIDIPLENVFSVENLGTIMDKIKEGGSLNDL